MTSPPQAEGGQDWRPFLGLLPPSPGSVFLALHPGHGRDASSLRHLLEGLAKGALPVTDPAKRPPPQRDPFLLPRPAHSLALSRDQAAASPSSVAGRAPQAQDGAWGSWLGATRSLQRQPQPQQNGSGSAPHHTHTAPGGAPGRCGGTGSTRYLLVGYMSRGRTPYDLSNLSEKSCFGTTLAPSSLSSSSPETLREGRLCSPAHFLSGPSLSLSGSDALSITTCPNWPVSNPSDNQTLVSPTRGNNVVTLSPAPEQLT